MRNRTNLWVNFILFLTGLWLIVSPFVLGYSTLEIARNNDVYVGLVVGFLSLVALFWRGVRSSSLLWLLGIAGLWEISSPFVLVYSNNSPALFNDVVGGMIVVGLALWQILLSPEESEVINRHFRPNNYGPSFASGISRSKTNKKIAEETKNKEEIDPYENLA